MENNFNIIMDYIDEHIAETNESLYLGICNIIGYRGNIFDNCLKVLTGISLFRYINERRLYFAAKEIEKDNSKTVCEIAIDFGYSEQSTLTRSMKIYWGTTPTDVRNKSFKIPENKLILKGISNKETRVQRGTESLEKKCSLLGFASLSLNEELLLEVEHSDEYLPLDTDVRYEIVDLAEKLEVSPKRLLKACAEVVLEEECLAEGGMGAWGCEPLEIDECCMKLDLSYEELDEICQMFDCKCYDIDDKMVELYKKQKVEKMRG